MTCRPESEHSASLRLPTAWTEMRILEFVGTLPVEGGTLASVLYADVIVELESQRRSLMGDTGTYSKLMR
jgi:hypothetical protein